MGLARLGIKARASQGKTRKLVSIVGIVAWLEASLQSVDDRALMDILAWPLLFAAFL